MCYQSDDYITASLIIYQDDKSLKAIVLALANYKIIKCMLKIKSYITEKYDIKNFGVNTKIPWKLDIKSVTFARHSFDSD